MKMALPAEFEKRMKEQLGSEYEEYVECLGRHSFGGLRVNTLKLSPEEFEKISPYPLERIPWIQNGYFYPEEAQPAKHPFYFGGLYYLQEPSAMLPASLLPVRPGDKVLDLCAAPGGKSTELAARLNGSGVLVSNDISNSRAKALLKNIELFGIRNAVVVSETPERLSGYFAEYFDKILVDAPCSGEGMFRKSPSIMKNWEQYGTAYYNALQKQILPEAVKMLKPGGFLVYSTCTFSPMEDEGTVQFLLEQYPELEICPALPDPVPEGIDFTGIEAGRPDWIPGGMPALRHTVRLWPHKVKGEGHFIALLHKKEKEESSYRSAILGDTGNWKDSDNVKMDSSKVNRDSGKGNRDSGKANRDFSRANKDSDKANRDFSKANRDSGKANRISKNIKLPDEAEAFFKLVGFPIDPERLEEREGRIYLLPEGLPDLSGLRILRSGLLLGEAKKNRFEPSQALANALKKSEYKKLYSLPPEDTDVVKYLKCETIELKQPQEDGFVLVCAGDYPLGWGKVKNGNLKNKYLPGWRMM